MKLKVYMGYVAEYKMFIYLYYSDVKLDIASSLALEIDHTIISTVILPTLLSQGQLSDVHKYWLTA